MVKWLVQQVQMKPTTKGCIKHQCENYGKKETLNPPEDYIEEKLESGDSHNNFKQGNRNGYNLADPTTIQKWCTRVPNRYGYFIFKIQCMIWILIWNLIKKFFSIQDNRTHWSMAEAHFASQNIFTPREQFALLPFAKKNCLLQIVLLQFAP